MGDVKYKILVNIFNLQLSTEYLITNAQAVHLISTFNCQTSHDINLLFSRVLV